MSWLLDLRGFLFPLPLSSAEKGEIVAMIRSYYDQSLEIAISFDNFMTDLSVGEIFLVVAIGFGKDLRCWRWTVQRHTLVVLDQYVESVPPAWCRQLDQQTMHSLRNCLIIDDSVG